MQNTGLGQIDTNNLCCKLMDDSWRLLAGNVMNTFSANGTFYLLRDQMLICGGKAIDFSRVMTFKNSPSIVIYMIYLVQNAYEFPMTHLFG